MQILLIDVHSNEWKVHISRKTIFDSFGRLWFHRNLNIQLRSCWMSTRKSRRGFEATCVSCRRFVGSKRIPRIQSTELRSSADESFNPINSCLRVRRPSSETSQWKSEAVKKQIDCNYRPSSFPAPTIGGADETDSIYQPPRPLSSSRSDTFIFHSRPMLHESITSEGCTAFISADDVANLL